MDVEQFWIPLVHLDQDGVGKLPFVGHNVDANFLEWRQILGLLRSDVGLVETPVFIAANVLNVQYVFVVILPEKIADTAVFVVSNGAIIRLSQRANPDIQDAIDGRQISQLGAVRGNLRVGTLRISE